MLVERRLTVIDVNISMIKVNIECVTFRRTDSVSL